LPKVVNGRRLMKRVFRIYDIVIFAVVLVVVISLLWLVPAVVSWKIQEELSKVWDGRVRIENVRTSYFGPIYLGEVIFYDKTGRGFIQAGGVKIVLKKWPALHPVLAEIEIEKLIARLSTTDGKFSIPVISLYKKSYDFQKKTDIRKFLINNAEVVFTDARNAMSRFDNLKLRVTKENVFYNFTLSRAGSAPPESLLAKGRIDSKTLQTELSLQLQHTVQQPETAPLFAVLNNPEMSAGGKLAADLRITGPLKQPAEMNAIGTINLDEWTILKDNEIIADNLTTQVNVKDQRFDFENITATVFDGNVAGTLHIETKQNRLTGFNGWVSAQKMNFTKVTSILGDPNTKAKKGTLTLNYNFSCNGKNLQNLNGEGQIFLDDADISIMPSITSMFKAIGLAKLDPLKNSDAACIFTSVGPVITIKKAHISNRFAAINVEPGGTINLQTDQIDAHIIAAPIKQVDAIAKNIPLVNIFNNIKNKLIRLRVKGKRTDPPAKLIKKEPIKDIKDATIGFFQDAINNVGQINRQMKKRFRSLKKSENEPNSN
jgi:hypothetical protein